MPGITNKWPKFRHGDRVKIADDLGPHMSHFPSGCEATVIHLEWKHYGNKPADYGLYIKGHGDAAWYHEQQLTLIERFEG